MGRPASSYSSERPINARKNPMARSANETVTGATSYIVQAGSQPGGSDVFNGNVGNTTAVSAPGLPSSFRAFVRVLAVNACGVSTASPEVAIGGTTDAR